jgi:hypothetical protein
LPKELIPELSISKEAVQSLPILVQHGSQDQLIELQPGFRSRKFHGD